MDDARKWLEHLFVPGERHEFLPHKQHADMDSLVWAYPTVTLEAAVTDVFGQTMAIAQEMFIAEAWERLEKAAERFQRPPLERLVSESEKSRKALETTAKELRRLVEATKRRPPPAANS